MTRLSSEYLESLRTTSPLDETLGILKQDAVIRFKAGKKTAAQRHFQEGVVDAIKNVHKEEILDRELDRMFYEIHLANLANFEADLDQIIDHVLEQAKIP